MHGEAIGDAIGTFCRMSPSRSVEKSPQQGHICQRSRRSIPSTILWHTNIEAYSKNHLVNSGIARQFHDVAAFRLLKLAAPCTDDSMPRTLKPQTWRRRVFRGIAIYAILPYLAVIAIFTLAQRRLMYRPSVSGSLDVNTLKLDAEKISDIRLTTSDGHILNGWLLNAHSKRETVRSLVIYFPGNSMNRFERLADLLEIASYGYDVLIFDYRGFGDSTGSPSESAISGDAELIWQYACGDLGYVDKDIVIFGESLGGAVALSLWLDENSAPPKPQALILSSTFASMPRTVQCNYPWFPFQYLILDRWPSIDRIHRVACPVTILHGSNDEMVPISEARLLAAAGSHANFIEVAGAGHNDVPMHQLRSILQGRRNTIN